MKSAVDLYLDLMKKTLINWAYGDYEMVQVKGDNHLWKFIINKMEAKGYKVLCNKPFEKELRRTGKDWPPTAFTMIGIERLNNLQNCLENIMANNIQGDFIETGVWRGGATIFMRAFLKAYGITNRKVWVADSFEGLPKPNAEKYPADKGDSHYTYDYLKVSLEQVRNNFAVFDLLDSQVCFLKGWFKDTLPQAKFEELSLIRLDGDMYESTMDAISNLYPKLSLGGYLIVDDYCIPSCRAAIHDYRKAMGIESEEIIPIDGVGVYWQRTC
jgi:O-methyltransferase